MTLMDRPDMPPTWVEAFDKAREQWDHDRNEAKKFPRDTALAAKADESIARVELIKRAAVADLLELLRLANQQPFSIQLRDLLQKAFYGETGKLDRRLEEIEVGLSQLADAIAGMQERGSRA